MVYPIIPLFITGTLGAPALAVGLTEGVAEATAHLTKLFSGRWSDQVGRRRPFVVAGYSLAAAGKAILAVAPGWPVALGGRSVDRFGKGLRTAPRDAMLSDFADESHRGLVFGLHRSMDTLGAVVGPLVGLALLAWFDDRLRVVIAIAIVPGVISIFVLRWLPERGVRAETGSSGWRLGELPRRFYIYLGITLIFMIGNSSDAFLILRAQNLGLTTTLVVLAYVVYNVVYACLALPAGAVSDQIPRGWLVVAGWGVFGAVYAGFALTSSQAALWPLFLVYGAYIALTDGVARALVADLTSEQLRSTAMGLFQGITGMAALFASVGAGLLWDHVSVAAPFVLGSGCALAAAVALAGFTLAGGLRPMRTPV
jgi:MFS family permease